MGEITRFAPSPTGYLHLGHAASALFAARNAGDKGRFLLRIEDIDQTRARPEYIEAIYQDLAWLGLSWETPVRIQSAHFNDYQAVLDRLTDRDLLYPCFCTRKEIQAEIARIGNAPHGPDGALYPGACRHLSVSERADRIAAGDSYALRLDMGRAIKQVGKRLYWHDRAAGRQVATPEIFGDVVLARKDTPTSYHVSVTLDDHLQGISLVTRGEDLFFASHLHRLLQELLGYDVPEYHHHKLLAGPDGKRFAKRDKSETLRSMRERGISVADILTRIESF
ncbi:tRNA glutamyl-Q(34) synthetase GluQRS [Thalassospira sp. MCCC 1A01428]|uniref:tRNA glutamyl-Q(34) synthetase GluQRS n=1 Tax=Thalassospira sp. MCCC 1A01428 TaxID=1470575 RepID=UPI000A1E370E|nr:tRNA glutamyl-Q(34) synthetase GluQRS [Thalassospira sp. MCCC 1A01428]OSQ45130.1 glutamyl-tRNA synthetase [Thalassospira sp. MCCC 1A01428]